MTSRRKINRQWLRWWRYLSKDQGSELNLHPGSRTRMESTRGCIQQEVAAEMTIAYAVVTYTATATAHVLGEPEYGICGRRTPVKIGQSPGARKLCSACRGRLTTTADELRRQEAAARAAGRVAHANQLSERIRTINDLITKDGS